MHLPAFACCAFFLFFFSRSLAEPGGTAVARTCWTRPPLVRAVSRGPPRRHKAPGLAKFRIPATVRRCCHPVTGWGFGVAVAVAVREREGVRARSRAPDTPSSDSGHRGRGGQRPRAAVVRGSRGGWQRTWHPTPRPQGTTARFVEAAEPQLCVASEGSSTSGFGGSWTAPCTRPQGRHGAARCFAGCRRAVVTARRPTETNNDAPAREPPCLFMPLWAYY